MKRTLKKEWKVHEIAQRGTWFDLFRAYVDYSNWLWLVDLVIQHIRSIYEPLMIKSEETLWRFSQELRRCSLGGVSKYSYETNLKWLRSLYLIEIRVYFIDARLTEVSLLDHLWAIGGGWQFGDIGRDALGRNWLKGRIRPVLKHGPRSLTCMRNYGL